MNRRDAIRRVAATGAALALPAFAQNNRIVGKDFGAWPSIRQAIKEIGGKAMGIHIAS